MSPIMHLFKDLRRLPQIVSMIVFGLGALIFLGWLLDSTAVRHYFPGISPTTAFTFTLLSAALWLRLAGKARPLALACAGAAALIGVLKLGEVVFGIDTGIDHLIVINFLASQPKLFAPNAALNFVLISAALILFDSPVPRRIKWGQLLTLLATLIAFLALAGHVYNLTVLYNLPSQPSMSLSTTLLFCLLCFSSLFAQRDRGLLAILTHDTVGGVTMRRLLPVAILAPMILGGLRILGGHIGLFTPDVGVILFGTSMMVVLVIVLYWNAHVMDRADQERRGFEQALRESETRYRELFEHSSDALVVADDQGHYIDANPQAEHVTGYTRDELLRLSVGDLTPPRDALPTGRERFAVVKQRGVLSGETVIIRKDGSEVEIEFSATTVAPGLHLAISRDISERKRIEQALRASEVRHRTIFEYSSDAIFIFNQQGQYLDANPQAERLTGYSHDELLSLPPGALTAPEKPLARETIFNEVKRGGQVFSEYVIVRKDGSEVAVEFAAVAIAPGVYQSIIHDISERKAIEENLRRALEQERELNELKTRFVSMVSHEFRTPLAVIQSSTDILLRYSDRIDADTHFERLEKIQLQVSRIVQMLENILIVGRDEVIGIEFKSERLDMREFCAELVTEFQSAAPTHKIIFNSSGDCGDVTADPKLLRRVITNLLSNAVKYSPQQETVLVDLVCGETELVMRVQDHGIGIPEADQKHLFELFHRAGNVGEISGTGLGLSIVKQAVDAHGGTIQLESGSDIGTTFIIHLPRLRSA